MLRPKINVKNADLQQTDFSTLHREGKLSHKRSLVSRIFMESCLEGKTVAEEEALATVINAGF